MQLRRKKFGERGFGIVQTCLLAAAILIAALVGTSFINKQSKQSKLRRQNSKYQILVDNLQTQLNDAMICSSALSGQSLGTTLGSWANVTMQLGYGATLGPITAGWKAKEEGYDLRQVQLSLVRQGQMKDASGNVLPRTVVYDYPRNASTTPNSFLKFYGRLRIVPNDAHWDVENEDTWVKLAVILTPAGLVHQCFGEFSPAEACETNGGAYDASSQSLPDERCNPDIFCMNHSVGLVADSGVCAYPYVPNPMGYIDGAFKYLCTWCNRNR